MIISGHQPCYLPWLGYFHKYSLCDKFVYMDTVQYLENDWNNRNKIKTPQGSYWLTVPIDRKKTKGKKLNEIIIHGYEDPKAKGFWQNAHWKTILSNYKKSTCFYLYEDELYEMYQAIIWERLADLCWYQFLFFLKCLGLEGVEIIRMSEMKFEGEKDKLVLDHCLKLNGDAVVFGMHGKDYVDASLFKNEKINLYFQNYIHPTYKQRFNCFESNLSILDLLLNHGADSKNIMLDNNMTKELLVTGQYWTNP